MTESTGTVEPTLQITVEVAVGADRAFEVFTTEFDRIKPREHNLLDEDIAETVLEPWAGGRLFDRGVDGAECHWGRVLDCEPPHRLRLAWHISPHWQLETDADRYSEVEITFTEVPDGRTRVELEHRHLDRHGEGWSQAKEGLAGDGGWPLYLSRYETIITA